MRAGLFIALLSLACGSGSTGGTRAPSASDPAPWSTAGRRARVRHAWHCTNQGVIRDRPVSGGGGVVAPPAAKRRARSDCDYLDLICAEIAKGHQAWESERDACARR